MMQAADYQLLQLRPAAAAACPHAVYSCCTWLSVGYWLPTERLPGCQRAVSVGEKVNKYFPHRFTQDERWLRRLGGVQCTLYTVRRVDVIV